MFSTVFFSLAFVCIGLDTRLKDIISRENRNVLWSFVCAQIVNIIITFIMFTIFSLASLSVIPEISFSVSSTY